MPVNFSISVELGILPIGEKLNEQQTGKSAHSVLSDLHYCQYSLLWEG
jgi:hypothetical protein